MDFKEIITGLNGLFDGLFIASLLVFANILTTDSSLLFMGGALIASVIFAVLRFMTKD